MGLELAQNMFAIAHAGHALRSLPETGTGCPAVTAVTDDSPSPRRGAGAAILAARSEAKRGRARPLTGDDTVDRNCDASARIGRSSLGPEAQEKENRSHRPQPVGKNTNESPYGKIQGTELDTQPYVCKVFTTRAFIVAS